MVNRSKNIGTAAETAVVRAARAHGFPLADRLTMKGRFDEGDILLCPDAIVEVKGGAAAKNASPGQIALWLQETRTEIANKRAGVGFLAVQRRGIGLPNAHLWDAWFPDGMSLCDDERHRAMFSHPFMVTVQQAFWMLRRAGWGEPMEEQP